MSATLNKVIDTIESYQQSNEVRGGRFSDEDNQERKEAAKTLAVADFTTKEEIKRIQENCSNYSREDLRNLSKRTYVALEAVEEIISNPEEDHSSIVGLLKMLRNSLNELIIVIREARSKKFQAKFKSFEEKGISSEEEKVALERLQNFRSR